MDNQNIVQATQVIQMTATAVQPFALHLIVIAKAFILPLMFSLFGGALLLRALIYYTVKREDTFAKEFEKRVNRQLDFTHHNTKLSFFIICKKVLEQTYYEVFENRAIMKRRNLDFVVAPSDRIFLVQPGCAFLVRDTLKEVKFLKFTHTRPPLLDIVKNVFSTNPCFTKVFGYLPVTPFNDFLNALPGLFIVGGIFGTFLGIMQALPELGAMDIRDPESTKLVMDTFLAKIAFSMSTSTIGIFLSVVMTVYNNFLSPERLFRGVIERFERNLFRLWNRSLDNMLPEEIPQFDEHRDPIEALASMALDKELTFSQKWDKESPPVSQKSEPTAPPLKKAA